MGDQQAMVRTNTSSVLGLRRGPAGGAVGDQAGDGAVGFAVGLAAPGVPLERAPLAVFGVGVLDADPA
ncbi:hypothetical protein [Streptomyces cyaneofuscatus]|uniref:hypothetical protein n=1 Tax=Streptomyces cyaneofuscatus TaxID=66883 RepID=UPI0037BCD802